MIRCPYCLEQSDPKKKRVDFSDYYICSNSDCRAEIHRGFLDDASFNHASVGLVGFPGNGKTVYITSLFYSLHCTMMQLGKWPEFCIYSLDDHTHNIFYEQLPRFVESRLPVATPVNFPLPALLKLTSIPYYSHWYLSIYDTSGEVFEDRRKITDQGRFVAHSDTVLFLLSISDYGPRWPDRFADLLDTYIRAVYGDLGVELKKRQNIVFVLTKADVLLNDSLPPHLHGALHEGHYGRFATIDSEMRKKMKERSKLIEMWIRLSGANGFANMARDNFKSVEYTMVSSTGAAPVGDTLATPLQPEDPKGVIEPFLWIVEKNRPRNLFQMLAGG